MFLLPKVPLSKLMRFFGGCGGQNLYGFIGTLTTTSTNTMNLQGRETVLVYPRSSLRGVAAHDHRPIRLVEDGDAADDGMGRGVGRCGAARGLGCRLKELRCRGSTATSTFRANPTKTLEPDMLDIV